MARKNTKKSSTSKETLQLSTLRIRLLQGFVYASDRRLWSILVTFQDSLREYFAQIGLYLLVDLEDGYAFLRSSPGFPAYDTQDPENAEVPDDDESSLERKVSRTPSLVRRFQLTFDVSLLCVLLREALEQFDETVSDDHRLILSYSDIHELLKSFYPKSNDETKLRRKFEAMIGKIEDLGFIRSLKGVSDVYEVTRPIRAFVDAEQLQSIKLNMKEALHGSSRASVKSH